MSSMWKVAHVVCGATQREPPQSGYDSLDTGSAKVPTYSTLDGRIADLEAALVEERRRSQCKEEELSQTRTLLAKLEDTVEQQAQVSQLDQQHLVALEAALAKQQQQQPHPRHHQACRPEQHAHKSADSQRAMDLEHTLLEQSRLLAQKDGELGELRQLVSTLEGAVEQQTCLVGLTGAQMGVAEPLAQTWEEEPEEEHETNRRVSPGQTTWEPRADELARRVAELEEQVVDKEVKIVELMQALSRQREEADNFQRKLAETEALLMRTTQQAGERNDEFERLQQQLVDELSKRQRVQMQLLDKARHVCELQESLALEIKLREEAADARTLDKSPPRAPVRCWSARQTLTESPKSKVLDGSLTARSPANGPTPPVMKSKGRGYSLEAPVAKPGSQSPEVQGAQRQVFRRTSSFAANPVTAPSELNRSTVRAAGAETTSIVGKQSPPVPPLASPVTPVGSVNSSGAWRMVSAPSFMENGNTSKPMKPVSGAPLTGAQVRNRAFCAPPPVVQHLGSGGKPPTPTVQRRLMLSSRSFT